jgi:hypothetical protein
MPYIEPRLREGLDYAVDELADTIADQSVYTSKDGQFNYAVSKLLQHVFGPPSYYEYSRAMGVLESIKQEFYRTVVAPYEDVKRKENGDV